MRGSGLVLLVLAASLAYFLVPARLAAATTENPRLARLDVEVWPEFDSPGQALVILRGELAPGTALPATLNLRIPASSGGPSAVASAASFGGSLITRDYQVKPGDDAWTVLSFNTPDLLFQVEYYDAMALAASRSYTFAWSGDFAVERLAMLIQEPAASMDVLVEPDLATRGSGAYGLSYRSADLGPLEAGKPLQYTVRYSKADARTSSEILGLQSKSAPAKSSSRLPLIAGVAVFAAVAAAVVYYLVSRQRAVEPAAYAPAYTTRRSRRARAAALAGAPRARSAPARVSRPAAFCPSCGSPLGKQDRFCSGCGSPVGARG